MNHKKTLWWIVGLVGAYVACQMIADIGASKLISIGSVVIPGGTFVFALTFTIRDMIHKRLGRTWAVASIWVAGIVNVFMALYFVLVNRLPGVVPPVNEAFSTIFSVVPAIVIASILAEIVSELLDTSVYHRVAEKFGTRYQWLRVFTSNLISLPVDSIIFVWGAFVFFPYLLGGNPMPISATWAIMGGQILWKMIVTLVSTPLIYLIPDRKIIGWTNDHGA